MTLDPVGRNAAEKSSETATPLLSESSMRRGFATMQESLSVSVRRYQFLRGMLENQRAEEFLQIAKNLEMLTPEQRESVRELRQIMLLTKFAMIRMNKSYPGLPPDSVEKTLDLVTRPGASVVILKGTDATDRLKNDQILGYGIVIRGVENFPDARHIPAHVFHPDDNHRLIRLFVTDTARQQLPPGEAFSRIIDEIKSISSEGRIIGMVLTDIIPLVSTNCAPEGKQEWLEAKSALEKRGFEDKYRGFADTGEVITEVITRDAMPSVAVQFHWFVWPPHSSLGERTYQANKARFQILEDRQRERLAGILPALPLSGGLIQFVGNSRDAFDVAFQFPGNTVHAEVFKSSEAGANRGGHLRNLISSEKVGSILLPEGSVDAVVVNGVLPDIIPHTADASERQKAFEEFLRAKKKALREGGVLVIRDTVAPSSRDDVRLRLSTEARPQWCAGRSLVELFEHFVATRIEGHISDKEWTAVHRIGDVDQYTEFHAPYSIVAEFTAKAPYASDWSRERLRPYTIHSAEERISAVTKDGFRILYAGPERSAFVQSHYRDDLIEVRDLDGKLLEPLSTNYITVATKLAPEDGVGFTCSGELPFEEEGFVSVRRYAKHDVLSGAAIGYRDVASRRGVTLDIVPYAIHNGHLYVVGRIYPRPFTVLHPALDGSVHAGYMQEQIASIVPPDVLASDEGLTVQAQEVLRKKTLIEPHEVDRVDKPNRYFVRPDTVDEEVVAMALRVPELPLEDRVVKDPGIPFDGQYRLRSFDALKLLQGQQVGFSEDPRLERKVYELLLAHGLSRGPWLGEQMRLSTQYNTNIHLASVESVLHPNPRVVFRRVADPETSFLKRHRREFAKISENNEALKHERPFEYVEPDPSTGFGHESVSILPVARVRLSSGEEEILVGLEMKDLVAPQEPSGSRLLATIPTARLPRDIHTQREAQEYASQRFRDTLGIKCMGLKTLGGKYMVSPGITPEVMYPMIAEVDLETSLTESLVWISCKDVLPQAHELMCGQAITSLYRAAHQLSLSSRGTASALKKHK